MSSSAVTTRAAGDAAKRRRPLAAVMLFIRQVVAELAKVVWPTPTETAAYTGIVLAFLIFMVALTGGFDAGVASLMLKVFG